MALRDRTSVLGYSTLVHPSDTWDQLWTSIQTYLPAIKDKLGVSESFPVSLRLSNDVVQTLLTNDGERDRLSRWLADNHMYVYTANAFPYGRFKGTRVMEKVYEPDWTTDDRVSYTKGVAHLLVGLSRGLVSPTIQTVPIGFRRTGAASDVVYRRVARQLFKVVAGLIDIEERTGCRVKLALEPEPYCFLEGTDDVIRFFDEFVYSEEAAANLAQIARLPVSEAIAHARRHLGVVFDCCHQAALFEDVIESIKRILAADIPIFKLQLASALWAEDLGDETLADLARFGETIYLSQTFVRSDRGIQRFLTIPDALRALVNVEGSRQGECRSHVHVPIFLSRIGRLRTTRSVLEEVLELHRNCPIADQLEIETYTWDVLPRDATAWSLVDGIVRELEWATAELEAR